MGHPRYATGVNALSLDASYGLLVQYGSEVLAAVKRNTIVLGAVLFIFATFAWAGWANFEFRQQAAERLQAQAAKGVLVADGAGDAGRVCFCR